MNGNEPTEREIWEALLPLWAIELFLAPFADEVGHLRAWVEWAFRCFVVSCFIVAGVPTAIIDKLLLGLIAGAGVVLLLAMSHVDNE